MKRKGTKNGKKMMTNGKKRKRKEKEKENMKEIEKREK